MQGPHRGGDGAIGRAQSPEFAGIYLLGDLPHRQRAEGPLAVAGGGHSFFDGAADGGEGGDVLTRAPGQASQLSGHESRRPPQLGPTGEIRSGISQRLVCIRQTCAAVRLGWGWRRRTGRNTGGVTRSWAAEPQRKTRKVFSASSSNGQESVSLLYANSWKRGWYLPASLAAHRILHSAAALSKRGVHHRHVPPCQEGRRRRAYRPPALLSRGKVCGSSPVPDPRH